MGDELVSTEQIDHVLVISMQREAKRNAVDRHLADGIDGALNRLDDDPDLWVGVLTGTPIVFSAGSDMKTLGDNATERGGEYGIIRRQRRKPLIAAVEGPALGGGMEIVLACDMAVAASTATFGLPEVVRGLVPTSGALFRVLSGLPVNLARELVLTGRTIDAREAQSMGLVNRIAEPGAAVADAIALAQEIAANSPVAVQACLAALNGQLADGDERGWSATRDAMDAISGSEDAREGMAAFFERRPPQWTGR